MPLSPVSWNSYSFMLSLLRNSNGTPSAPTVSQTPTNLILISLENMERNSRAVLESTDVGFALLLLGHVFIGRRIPGSVETNYDSLHSSSSLRLLASLEITKHSADVAKAHDVVAVGEGPVISHFLGGANQSAECHS